MCRFSRYHTADLPPYESQRSSVLAAPRGCHGRQLVAMLLVLALGAFASLMLSPRGASASAFVLAREDYADRLLMLMNQERAAAGLPELALCRERSDVAAMRSLDMAAKSYFAHFNSEGIGAERLLRDYPVNFRLLGENIARANYPADQVVGVVHGALMASEHHRDNVLDARLGRVGVAVAYNGDRFYFAVVFTD